MRTFKLTVFARSRVLLGLFLMPVAIIGFTLLAAEINSILLGVLFSFLFLLTWFYYTIGNLDVTIDDKQLHFHFKRKVIFNYKTIPTVNVDDIITIVIDKGDLFRKIITSDRIIYINTTKFKKRDIHKFIYNLEVLTKKNGVRRINSWGEWKENGYLKTAYYINNIVLIFGIVAVAISIIFQGFSSRQLLIVLFIIPQLIFYGMQMKQAMKK